MDNFVVSARKYRPQDFSTVVGQSAITNTLRNAIDNNHLAQAFLFCGPRGVGKTSCARILAREINKHSAKEKGEDPNADFSLNIFELDAASNNSVDDIRNLTDQVRFAPQVGSYKVYIIDEVHMLSQQAFNAFLKTLEEPPAHAIFILATTEKHKILPTILSRCQIFDFQRITVGDIATHLASIAEKENVKADPEGLNIIAEKADGAMRDALSMFDQLVSFAGNELTYQSVIENLNVLDYDFYFRMVDHVTAHQIPECLLVYNEILNKGFDGHNFIVGLAQHLRNLMVCKNAQTINLIETSDSIRNRYSEQSTSCSVRFIFKALEILNDADIHYKASKNQRLLVELTLIRMCAITTEKKNADASQINNTSNRLSSLERPAPQAAPQPTTAASIPSPPVPPPSEYTAPQPDAAPIVSEEKMPEPATAEKTPIEPDEKPFKIEKPVVKSPDSDAPDSGTPVGPVQEEKVAAAVVSDVSTERKKVLKRFQSASVSISAGLRSTVQENVPALGEDSAEYETLPDRLSDSFSTEQLLEKWGELTQLFRDQKRDSLSSTLAANAPELLENETIRLVISNAAQEVELNRAKGELLDFLREKLQNFSIEITFEIEKTNQPTGLYTNSQKFEAMVKKNPNLGRLSKNLNLDIY